MAPELALAIAMLAGVLVEYHARLDAYVLAAAAVMTLPLAGRLLKPIWVAGAVAGGLLWFVHTDALSTDSFPLVPVIAWGFALWAVGSRCRPRTIAAVGVLSLVAWVAAAGVRAPAGHLAAGALFVGCGLLIGRAMGVLQFEADAYAEQTARLAEERDKRAEQAVRDERRRIARELHDVISHSISVMGVQAGAVRTVLEPDQVRQARMLMQIEQTGRETIVEMRRLLGLLRHDAGELAEPTQGMAGADRLVEQLRATGLAVTLTVTGDLGHLPAGVDLAAFRILQEALTNVLKHAPTAHVQACVARTAEQVSIAVVDDGGGRSAAAHAASGMPGHGLLGMQERAALYAGTVAAQPRPGGGFAVHAVIPVAKP